MWALYVKEIRSFLSSLIGYVVIGVFLAITGIYLWVNPDPDFNIFLKGKASLEPLFRLAPYVFLLLIPAITMRSFAEEKRVGTIELLLTKPVTDYQVILAKFFAGLTLVLLAVLPTLVYYLCVDELKTDLSQVDTGKMWGSYIGLVLLGASYVSIGLFASALSSNQVVGFILGTVMCLFMLEGFNGLSILVQVKDAWIMKLGIAEHHHFIKKGLVDTRDLLYFVSLITFFLVLTKVAVSSRMWSFSNGFGNWVKTNLDVVLVFALVVIANFISGYKFTRFDLTHDQRYSLKEATVNLLENDEIFSDKLLVQVYFTGDLPPDWENFRNEIELKLEEYKVVAGDKISIEFVDAFEDEAVEAEELSELRELGLDDVWASDFSSDKESHVRTIPGAVLSYDGGEKVAVPFIPIELYNLIPGPARTRDVIIQIMDDAIIDFEYNMTSAIRKAVTREKPVIAFLRGHGELDEIETKSARESLKEYYDVTDIDILEVKEDSNVSIVSQVIHSLDLVDLLIINKPEKEFKDIEKFVIDQFVMNGGRVIWAIDMIDDNRDSLYSPKGFTYGIQYENDLNLLDQLHKYGVRIEPVLVLENTLNSAPCHLPFLNEPGKQPPILYRIFDWNFYPLVVDRRQPVIRDGKEVLDEQHIITRGIMPVKLEYASYLSVLTEKKDQVKKTVLLETSDSTSFRRAPIEIFSNIIMQKKNQNQQYLPVAVLLEGKFESVWKNRLAPRALEEEGGIKILQESKPTRQIVISDGDVFKNEIDSISKPGIKRPIQLSHSVYGARNQQLAGPIFGNRDFLMNSVEYLLGEETLMATRRQYIPDYIDQSKVEAQKSKWTFINVAIPLIFILLFGIVNHFIRIRKYVKRKS